MPILLAVLICALLLAAPAASQAAATPDRPAAAASVSKKKKKQIAKKRKACRRKANRIKSRKARKRAVAKCKRIGRKRVRRPVVTPPAPPALPAPARVEGGVDDVTVVAVLDGGINPYHWDFLSAKMPQHLDGIRGNDIPLDRPATEWLDGFAAAASGFKSFSRIDLELDANDPDASAEGADANELQGVKASAPDALNAHWIPGTKIIGAMSFSDSGEYWQGTSAHGVGTTSSVAGNLHGTCPECLLFFIDYGDTAEEAEAAIEWAERQPWIDVISNSYGHGGAVPKIYAGSDVAAQRAASERGQTIVFSAGNGIENAYAVSNPTTYSSQKGPDWLITVGAVQPGSEEGGGGSYSGAGKPVDVAGVGNSYPNAYGAQSVGGEGTGFSGTSNAAPTIAGLYARALYRARTLLGGPSRVQRDGVIAAGTPIACGAARSGCELADGALTGVELRTRLLHAATHTSAGMAVYTAGGPEPSAPPVGEDEFLNEGHGTFFARDGGPADAGWLEEFDRIAGPMEGSKPALERPEGELEWMIVDSYCRQQNWGGWSLGYYVDGVTTLPGYDQDWPVRSSREQTCPGGPTPGG